MYSDMYYLNLPKIPDNIISEIKLESNLYIKNESTSSNVTEYLIPEIKNSKKIINLYSKYFDEEITSCEMLILRNTGNILGNVKAHFDIFRKTAIDYYIDTGENELREDFFNIERTDEELHQNLKNNLDEKNLIVDKSYDLKINQWHCFNPQIAHAIKNLKVYSLRIILVLEPNIKFVDFVKKYDKYVINKL